MSSDNSLFRKEALEARHVKWMGEIVLVRPTSFSFLTLIAVIAAFVVVIFFTWGTYTKRSTVVGQLLPSTGQVKVYAPQPGIVMERFVQDGERVKQGDPLLSITSERYGAEDNPIQAAISRQLRDRRGSLEDELVKVKRIQEDERRSLESKVISLESELRTLEGQADSQRRLVDIASDAAKRYQGLLDQGYISMDQLQQRQADLLAQRLTLKGLERERTSLIQQLNENRNQLSGLAARQDNEQSNIQRQLWATDQELVESEAKRTLRITAPEAGLATAIFAEPGQSIDTARPLMSIVSEDAVMQAELYAPSRAIGFISKGDKVQIRYQSYPYQKFGQYHGEVISISKTTVTTNELASLTGGFPGLSASDGEQFYRIRVRLDDQEVIAYGQPRPLQSGMLLDADIMQETRRLYEWVLEPLFSLTGKL